MSDNPSLTKLDLSSISNADLVAIRGNAQLAEVDVRALFIAERLELVDKPLLPLTTFAGVAAAVKELSVAPAP